MPECLVLCFIGCNAKAQPDRKLSALKLKREDVVREGYGDPWDEDGLAGVGTVCDGSHYDMTVEAGDHIAGAITVTVCRVEVAQEHDRATNFELKFVLWHP